jgi:hypothetical protein
LVRYLGLICVTRSAGGEHEAGRAVEVLLLLVLVEGDAIGGRLHQEHGRGDGERAGAHGEDEDEGVPRHLARGQDALACVRLIFRGGGQGGSSFIWICPLLLQRLNGFLARCEALETKRAEFTYS